MKKVIHTVRNCFNTVIEILFPRKCVGCGKESEILCGTCLDKINYSSGLAKENIFTASDYGDDWIKKTIWLLKYRKIKTAAEPLAELIYRRIWPKFHSLGSATSKLDYLIIPIPLSDKRLKERGFNQSELIAKHLSNRINSARTVLAEMSVRLETNVLYKIRHTDTQVSIKDRQKRLNNLKGSFSVKNPKVIHRQNIILIDDVCTTGTTIAEARRTLKLAGAKKVIAFVVAGG